MKFEEFVSQIGIAVDNLSLALQGIIHNTEKERYEISLTHSPIYDWEISDADILMDYIANLDTGYVDGLNGNGERIDIYYNITNGAMAYYSIKDKCLRQK